MYPIRRLKDEFGDVKSVSLIKERGYYKERIPNIDLSKDLSTMLPLHSFFTMHEEEDERLDQYVTVCNDEINVYSCDNRMKHCLRVRGL